MFKKHPLHAGSVTLGEFFFMMSFLWMSFFFFFYDGGTKGFAPNDP